MQSINDRVWFFLSTYRSVENWESWDFESTPTSIRNWGFIDWDLAKKSPHIFFSRSPITFGHSIVVIPKPPQSKSVQEAQFFRWSSQFIEIAINIFQKAFGQLEIHLRQDFNRISKFTSSSGSYIKTLILKANANENISDIYKIHLIPYFSSHEIESQKRFRNAYPDFDLSKLKGGLLGWIGEQENRIDKREISLLFNEYPGQSDFLTKNLDKLTKIFRIIS